MSNHPTSFHIAVSVLLFLSAVLSPRASGIELAYRNLTHAQSNQATHAARIRSLVAQIKTLEATIAAVRQNAKTARQQWEKLQRDASTDMSEFRSGQFCSGCGKTRREIVASGDPFPHPGEETVFPTLEQMRERQRGWDDKISDARRTMNDAEDEERAAKSKRSELTNRLINFEADYWAGAVRAEGELRAQAWEAEKKAIQKSIAQAQGDIKLAALERSRLRTKATPAQLRSLKDKEDALKNRLAQLQSSLPKAREQHQKNLTAAFYSSLKVREELADLCGTLSNDMGMFSGSIMESKMHGLYFVVSLSGAYSNPLPDSDVWTPRNPGASENSDTPNSILEGGSTGRSAIDVLEGRKNR